MILSKEKQFVHLHVHTEYSLLDGAIRCKDLAAKTAGWGMPAVGISDHGVMYGVVEFYQECKAAGIKPIIGCEVYVAPDGIDDKSKGKKINHLLLIAENNVGYHNLVKLVSIASTDGFYYKPRVDHSLLSRYSEGIIAGSGCLAGEIPQFLIDGRKDEALERANLYRDIFGEDNFFLEVQYNHIPEQAIVNKGLLEMSREHGFNLIATNDSHYLNKEDYDWHEILLCVGTNSTLDDPGRLSFKYNDFYLRSAEEMWDLFGDTMPDALENTVKIAERCDVTFPLGTRDYKLPQFDIPEGYSLETFLHKSAFDGMAERLRISVDEIPQNYVDRLEYELGIINDMEFPGYFLIIADVIKACKERDIPIGPGRGSAAGSLVAYAMKITELDPLKYGLIFERFLNPERISMPDIDTDVSDKGREDLLKYVVEKYGVESVSQIITFGRMKSKAAIKDVGRAMAIPYAEVAKVAKLIPDGVKSIKEAISITPELKEIESREPQIRKMLDSASCMEGLARHCSQHAAGVVITPVPLTDLVPVRKIGENQVVTQFPMEPVEKLGLVKMDFLGLQTLSILEEALNNIRENGKEVPDLNDLPMNDDSTFKLLQRGDTLGVFQLESAGMRRLLKKMLPDCFEDLIAVLALYRPGPLESGMVDQYVECKHGRMSPHYLHPMLEDVLRETHGVILYQEQVMKCASTLAGYTLGGADLLRRAMGKKKVEVMNEQRAIFLEGAEKNGVDRAKADEIFDIIQKFAGYGFNKSHSAAYALISYQTAYLKTHYEKEFMAAYLTSQIGAKKEVMAGYVREVRKSGIDVLPPDINESRSAFTAVNDVVRFGLSAVAKVGSNAVDAILKARREGGRFSDLWDFIDRVDMHSVNKAVLENLIKVGAFDSLLSNRRQMIESYPPMLDYALKKDCDTDQCSLFGDCEVEEHPELVNVEDFELSEKLEMEKEAVGMYISGHPFEKYELKASAFSNCSINELPYWRSDKILPSFSGILTSFSEKITKRGDPMGILSVEDSMGEIEVVCFAKPRNGTPWLDLKSHLIVGEPYIVRGKAEDRGGWNVIANDVFPLNGDTTSKTKYLKICLNEEAFVTGFARNFVLTLKSFPGKFTPILNIEGDRERAMMILEDLKVQPGAALREAMEKLIPLDMFSLIC